MCVNKTFPFSVNGLEVNEPQTSQRINLKSNGDQRGKDNW